MMIVVAGIALSGSHARPLQPDAALIQGCEPGCLPLLSAKEPWGREALEADNDGCWGVCDAGLVFLGVFDEKASLGGPPWGVLPATIMAAVFDPVDASR